MAQAEKPASVAATSWARVALLCLVGITAALQIGKVPGQLHVIQGELHLSLFQDGLVLSIFSLIAAVAGIAVGTLAERFGNLRMIVTGLVLGGVASIAGSFSGGGVVLLASRVVEGFGFILATTSTPSLIVAETRPDDRGKALGLWSMYMPIGMSAMMLVGALLAGTLGWRGIWQLTAGLSLGYALVVWMVFGAKAHSVIPGRATEGREGKGIRGSRSNLDSLPSPLRGSPGMTAEPALTTRTVRVDVTGEGASLRSLFATALRPGPMLLSGCFLVYAGNFLALTGFLPLMLERGGEATAGMASLLTAIVVAANMTGNAASGFIAARGISRPIIIAVAAAVMGLAAVGVFVEALPFVARYGLALVFSAVGGIIPGTCFGAAQSLAESPSKVGPLIGGLIQGAGIGQLVGPPIVAAIVEMVGGWWGAALFIAAGALINVALALALSRSIRPLPRQALASSI